MTLIKKLLLAVAGAMVVNDLFLLGIPVKIGQAACSNLLQAVSSALFLASLVLVVAPYVYAKTYKAGRIMSLLASVLGYGLAAFGAWRFDSPMFTASRLGDFHHIVEVIMMTWSLAGAFSLAFTVYELHQHEKRAPCVPLESLPPWLRRAMSQE